MPTAATSSMRGASAESLDALVGDLATAVGAGADGNQVADDLFQVAALLVAEPRLRRVLTDQSLDAQAKSGLVRQVFGARLTAESVELVAKAAERRWASTRDLGRALEHLGVVAVVKQADRAGVSDALEGELFAFEQLVNDNPELRDVLSDPARSMEDKRGLLRSLLEGRATAGTIRLAGQAVTGSYRTVGIALEAYQKIAAAERRRLIGLVHVARPLDEDEFRRLADALSRQYDGPVHLNVVVDPSVIGGVRVEIGDDVIDGTVASRLDDARRRLAG